MGSYVNTRGETFIELLISTFLLASVLFVILSVFISAKQATVQSEQLTQENQLAVQLVEQLKAVDYQDLLHCQQKLSTSGIAQDLSLDELNDCTNIHLFVHPEYTHYELKFDLLPYEAYPLDQLLTVVVYVREHEDKPFLKKATLMRNGDLP